MNSNKIKWAVFSTIVVISLAITFYLLEKRFFITATVPLIDVGFPTLILIAGISSLTYSLAILVGYCFGKMQRPLSIQSKSSIVFSVTDLVSLFIFAFLGVAVAKTALDPIFAGLLAFIIILFFSAITATLSCFLYFIIKSKKLFIINLQSFLIKIPLIILVIVLILMSLFLHLITLGLLTPIFN